MSFRLGYETIVAQDDGGIHITLLLHAHRMDWIHGGTKPLPVISFEVYLDPFECKLNFRRNERSINPVTNQMLYENTWHKSFARCQDKSVINHSISTQQWHIKKYNVSLSPLKQAFVIHGQHDIDRMLMGCRLPRSHFGYMSGHVWNIKHSGLIAEKRDRRVSYQNEERLIPREHQIAFNLYTELQLRMIYI